jgi:hypothetical protein
MNAVSVSAVQDLFGIYAGASKAFEIQQCVLGQIGQTTVTNLRLNWKYLPATVTSGSGGSAATVSPLIPSDIAATITARANDTTQATTSGTAVVHPDDWNPINGYLHLPPERTRFVCPPSGAYILSLDNAPGAAITVSGTIWVAELF